DLFRGNVLLLGDRVSGVLDFEFSSPDLRAMDFAVGLFAFGVSARNVEGGWPPIEAFAAGYRRRVALSPEEIGALPMLLRLREAVTLVHWAGRLRQGLTTEGELARRSGDMLELDGWLSRYGEELVRRVENTAR
ncbi:MAG: phosphotransferase, partial [Rubrobacter sp.]